MKCPTYLTVIFMPASNLNSIRVFNKRMHVKQPYLITSPCVELHILYDLPIALSLEQNPFHLFFPFHLSLNLPRIYPHLNKYHGTPTIYWQSSNPSSAISKQTVTHTIYQTTSEKYLIAILLVILCKFTDSFRTIPQIT